MLKSHNDSAVAIAEHIGGSVEGFAEKMNEKAKELGCKDTHFVTPNGLDGEDDRRTSGETGAGKEIFRNIVMEIKKRENAV